MRKQELCSSLGEVIPFFRQAVPPGHGALAFRTRLRFHNARRSRSRATPVQHRILWSRRQRSAARLGRGWRTQTASATACGIERRRCSEAQASPVVRSTEHAERHGKERTEWERHSRKTKHTDLLRSVGLTGSRRSSTRRSLSLPCLSVCSVGITTVEDAQR